MAKSVRSKKEKRLRTIKRKKLEHWEKANIEQLSKSLYNPDQKVKMHSTGEELDEEQKANLSSALEAGTAMEVEEEKKRSLNWILKNGIPKRKKRNKGKYGKKRK